MLKAFIEKWERSMVIFVDDLTLLASLCLAQFIVWRTLRRRQRERATRLKLIHLVPEAGRKNED